MLAHVVAADNLIADDGIHAAILEVHEGRYEIRVLLDFLDILLEEFRLVHVLLSRRSALRADDLAGQALLIRDVRAALLHEEDLAVVHVRVGEQHVLFALLGDVEAVPEDVDSAALELRFLARPVDGLELDLAAQALRRFLCKIDIEARDLVVLVLEAHRREIVVKADDDLALVAGARTAVRCSPSQKQPS